MSFKLILNIVFYIFGIFLPILIIFVSLVSNRKKLFKNIILGVILFIIFYILKIGGFMFLENNKNIIDDQKKEENIDDVINEKEKKDPVITTVDGVTYVDGILIVNKTYSLPSDYEPTDTYTLVNGQKYCSTCINKEAYKKFQEMDADATSLGLHIWIQSGYRSYDLQKELYEGYIEKDGLDMANTYSAKPGHSEHQTGLAFDLNTITDDFADTTEGKWVNENAYRYGFILRYPKGKENYTGYKYESWHLRYVGEALAKILYNNGDWITLEEYYNLTSTYTE